MEVHSCTELMHKAKTFALKHFQEIIEGDEFVSITEGKLIEIISSDDLEVDKIECEELRWKPKMNIGVGAEGTHES